MNVRTPTQQIWGLVNFKLYSYQVLEPHFKCNQGVSFQLVFRYTHVNSIEYIIIRWGILAHVMITLCAFIVLCIGCIACVHHPKHNFFTCSRNSITLHALCSKQGSFTHVIIHYWGLRVHASLHVHNVVSFRCNDKCIS